MAGSKTVSNDRRWLARHFLEAHVILVAIVTGLFGVWLSHWHGAPHMYVALKDRREVLYGTLSSIDGALLGFVIATTAIVLGFAQSDRFAVLRDSTSYKQLWRVFTSAIAWLGLATLVALIALFVDRDDAPNRAALLAVVFTNLMGALRVATCGWALARIIAIVTRPLH